MSQNCYKAIWTYLYFADNNQQFANVANDSNNCQLYKVKEVAAYVISKFAGLYHPGQNLCLDELLLLFKGRLAFKQYIPSKRSRFGIKTFVLTDAATSYCLDFKIFSGKQDNEKKHEFGKSGSIVMKLLKNYLGKNHLLYCDNWYTSPKLFLKLAEKGVGALNTVKK